MGDVVRVSREAVRTMRANLVVRTAPCDVPSKLVPKGPGLPGVK